MRLTRHGDYAVRVVVDLASRPAGAIVPRARIQERQGVPPAYLAKIVQGLPRGGLVRTPPPPPPRAPAPARSIPSGSGCSSCSRASSGPSASPSSPPSPAAPRRNPSAYVPELAPRERLDLRAGHR